MTAPIVTPEVTPELFIDVMTIGLNLSPYVGKQYKGAVEGVDWPQVIYSEFASALASDWYIDRKLTSSRVRCKIRLELTKEQHYPYLEVAFTTNKDVKKVTEIKLKLHPKDLGIDALEELHVTLGTWLDGGLGFFVEKATVRKIEITIDLHGVPMTNVHVLPDQAKTSTTYRAGSTLETLYLGTSKANQTCIYDRGAKRAAKGQMHLAGTCTRVERKLINVNKYVMGLEAMKNPFANIKMVDIPAQGPKQKTKKKTSSGDNDTSGDTGSKDYIWTLFVDSVAQRTLDPALKLLPQAKRTQYRNHLKKHSCTWWNPAEIWQQWPEFLSSLKLTDPKYWDYN